MSLTTRPWLWFLAGILLWIVAVPYDFYCRRFGVPVVQHQIMDPAMQKLASLREKYASGLITEEEYERQRQALSQQTP